ncbi:MAG: heavy-metal-associated domain-containing protein [Candidatus Taylorbacteria bacterium]|nr:heavy-metal-associated domain-containing protein [Candidatus Taylorbacteria bacterium]
MTKQILKIEGMHCGACATGIQMILENTDGVKSVHVDYNKNTGEVEFDESKVKLEELLKQVSDLGYKAVPVS